MKELAVSDVRALIEAVKGVLALPLRCETCVLDGCAVDCDCPCHAERALAQAGLSAAFAALDAKMKEVGP